MKIKSLYSDIDIDDPIHNSLLKPIHQYAQKISPMPIIKNNIIIQKVYSESLVSINNNDISMLSRPAIQQYRKSKITKHIAPKNCFSTLFEFYVSWFIDIDKDVIITESKDIESPFYIPENIIINFNKSYIHPRIDLDPVWVPFFVKKDFLKFKKGYAKIELETIAYQIEM
jgi:hypothetical protein